MCKSPNLNFLYFFAFDFFFLLCALSYAFFRTLNFFSFLFWPGIDLFYEVKFANKFSFFNYERFECFLWSFKGYLAKDEGLSLLRDFYTLKIQATTTTFCQVRDRLEFQETRAIDPIKAYTRVLGSWLISLILN